MNLRTMAFAAIALVAFGTSAVSFAQTAPGPQGTPPPPPQPNSGPTSAPLITTSAQPTALPSPDAPPTTAPLASPSPDASASPSPSPGGRRHRGGNAPGPSPGPSPTDTPEPPQFSTLDGVWEVAFQPLNGARTSYSHLYVTQHGNELTGTWRRDAKTVVPFTGTFDGRLLKLTATNGTATYVFTGYEENYMDMVGLFTDGDPKHPGIPYTAAHRKRDRDRDIQIR